MSTGGIRGTDVTVEPLNRGAGGWATDLGMGARFAISGGREGWVRAILTAVGVGLGVALLLIAVSVPNIFAARNTVIASVSYIYSDEPGSNDLLIEDRYTTFRESGIHGLVVEPLSADSAVPPGLSELPGPGEMVVSPALAKALESDGAELLAPRLPFEVVGTISEAGLVGPADYKYYAGSDDLDPETAMRIEGFGAKSGPVEEMDPVLVMLVLIGVVVLLLPVAMFVAVAVRFGGERRDRRLAALRLIGADSRMVRRIASGEALFGALLGLLVGSGLFLIVRGLIEGVNLWEFSVYSAYITPDPVLGAVVVIAVPVLAVAVTMLAMRRLVIEPLGVMRDSTPRRRRLWWRLLLPVVGLLILAPVMIERNFNAEGLEQIQVAAGVIVLLLGVAALLPWAVDASVSRMRGGATSWQLATRRLQLSGGSTGRVVNGIAVAVAGGIALQTLFTSVSADFVSDTGVLASDPQVILASGKDDRSLAELTDDVKKIDGVTVRYSYTLFEGSIGLDGDPYTPVAVADCAVVEQVVDVADCTDGAVYSIPDNGIPLETPEPGESVTFYQVDDTAPAETDSLPHADLKITDAVSWNGAPLGGSANVLLITPAAIDGTDLSGLGNDQVAMDVDPATPDAIEHLRNINAGNATDDYGASVSTWNRVTENDEFVNVRRGLLIGITATMILIGVSLLVGLIEQIQERRRLLSALSAFGTRRRTIAASLLWQTAIPVVVGLVLAILTGTLLGTVLLRTVGGQSLAVDWSGIAEISGIGVAMILLVTLLSIPMLWRLMRPGGIRTE